LAEHNLVSGGENDLLLQLLELAGDKDKKKIEAKLKEIKPTTSITLLSTKEKINTVNKNLYLNYFAKSLHTSFLSFGRDYAGSIESFKNNQSYLSDLLNNTNKDFNLMLQQFDKRVVNSVVFIKNVNSYI